MSSEEDVLNEPVEGGVESAQIGGHHRHEDEGHGRGLDQRVTVGCFPWKFMGGEAAFCRFVAFV